MPINLNISGAENDTLIQQLFKDAFARYKIELISHEEVMLRIESEGRRVGQKVFTKGADFKNVEEIQAAMAKEFRYVFNRLSIQLELQSKDDSRFILKAGWNNTPFPPDFSRPPSAPKYRNIDLTNLSYSIKENVKSIVDSILYSKELK